MLGLTVIASGGEESGSAVDFPIATKTLLHFLQCSGLGGDGCQGHQRHWR